MRITGFLRPHPRCLALCAVLGAAGSAAEPPKLRLGSSVVPTSYTVELRVVPNEDEFSGRIEIAVRVNEPVQTVWLNATELAISEAYLTAGGRKATAKTEPGGRDFVGLAFDQPLRTGAARLHLVYRGKINRQDLNAVYQAKEGDDWYVYSHFEPLYARRAFPCFDEPVFKVPWQLSLEVREEHQALSNTPPVSETLLPGGFKRVRFDRTKPLPSYLIAFAVGPFSVADAGVAGRNKTRVRMITPRGKADQARLTGEITRQVLERLEEYFDIPYPYEKLDSLVQPRGGAMEHPGLPTYPVELVLVIPGMDPSAQLRSYRSMCAHELAHMWAGGLVGIAWWDDNWLKEGFARWVEIYAVGRGKSDSGKPRVDLIYSRFAKSREGPSALSIRTPAGDSRQARSNNIMDTEKGASLFLMLQSRLGPERFQRVVQRYLKKYAHRTATADDFLASLGEVAGKDVARAFASFLDQPGIPQVAVSLRCATGSPPALQLEQTRFSLGPSPGTSTQRWQIPVCVTYEAGGERGLACTLLTEARRQWPLPKTPACPTWVNANEDGAGYYRVRYSEELWRRLLAAPTKFLNPSERVVLLDDAWTMAGYGQMGWQEALTLASLLAKDPDPYVSEATAGALGRLNVPEELNPHFERFMLGAFREKALALGWEAKTADDDDTRMLRFTLLPLVAIKGGDPDLTREAARLAREWMAGRKSLAATELGNVLGAAAVSGDRQLFDGLIQAAQASKNTNERRMVLRSLGGFRDLELARRALGLIASRSFDYRDGLYVLLGFRNNPDQRRLPFEFVKEHFDELLAAMGCTDATCDAAAGLPNWAENLCSEADIPEVEAFFKTRTAMTPAGAKYLQQVVNTIRTCASRPKQADPGIVEFLRHY